jgi:hypothetical protein
MPRRHASSARSGGLVAADELGGDRARFAPPAGVGLRVRETHVVLAEAHGLVVLRADLAFDTGAAFQPEVALLAVVVLVQLAGLGGHDVEALLALEVQEHVVEAAAARFHLAHVDHPGRPGSGVKLPDSSPATSSERLADSIMSSLSRSAAGASQSESAANRAVSGTATSAKRPQQRAPGQPGRRQHRHLAVAVEAAVGQQHPEERRERQQQGQTSDRAQPDLAQQQRGRDLAARDLVEHLAQRRAHGHQEQHGRGSAQRGEELAEQVTVDRAQHRAWVKLRGLENGAV